MYKNDSLNKFYSHFQRKASLFLRIAIFLLVGIFSVSVVGADNAEDASPENAAVAIDESKSEAEMLPYVNNQLKESKHIEMSVKSMIDNARKEKDTVRILCIDDKLTQIQALLKAIDNRIETLNVALDAKDSGTARHQFVILQVSFNKINSLRVQADACVGNDDIVIGASESEVSISEEYISAPEATTPGQDIYTPEPVVRPSVASGFR